MSNYNKQKEESIKTITKRPWGEFIIGDKIISVKDGDCAYVPQGEKHRVINSDNAKSFIFVEIARGIFNEDDIIRYEDDYGRV